MSTSQAGYRLTAFPNLVQRIDNGAFVPNDPANADWIDYQAWLALGNTPTPFVAPTPTDLQKFLLYDAYTLFLLVELVNDLLNKGTIAASDFSATTRTVFTRAKALLATAEALLPPPP